MIIASLAMFPTSEGASVSRFVKEVIQILQDSGLTISTGGMSTTIESPDMSTLFAAIEKAEQRLVELGVKRIHIDLHVDHRLDKEATIQSKLKAIEKA